jgi:hypothetical protein
MVDRGTVTEGCRIYGQCQRVRHDWKHNSVPNTVEIHEIVTVFKAQPLLGREDIAKVGTVPNYVVVPTELLHSDDIVDREVEPRNILVEACYDWLRVRIVPCTRLHAAHGRFEIGARFL